MRVFGRFGVLIVGLVLALLLASCGGPDGRSAASGDWEGEGDQPALAVEAMEVTSGSIIRSISGSGVVEGINEATVVSEVQGTITSVSFDLGDFVEEGSILASVDGTIAALSLEEARQAFESARLDLSAAERRFENGSASQAELSRVRTVANGARARLEAAEETFRDHTIRAPISGYIASRGDIVGRGNFLTPGTPVARVVDLSAFRLEIAVGERELSYISDGSFAVVNVPICETGPFDAEVVSIAAGADPRTGSFPVVVEWPNTCGDVIRSGMSAAVEIPAQNGEELLIVPSSAIRRNEEGDFVYVAEGATVAMRFVELGQRLGERVEVVSGLAPGEVVIVSALSAIEDGSAVDATVVGRTAEVL